MKKKKLLRLIERHLEERIIDPCGYDPEKESHSDLVIMVKALSYQNEELLKVIREEQEKTKKRKSKHWILTGYRCPDCNGKLIANKKDLSGRFPNSECGEPRCDFVGRSTLR